jgi:hypothetical protein
MIENEGTWRVPAGPGPGTRFHQNETSRSSCTIVHSSGKSQPSRPFIDQSKNVAIWSRPTTRPHTGSRKTASSVNQSAIVDHGAPPRTQRARCVTYAR